MRPVLSGCLQHLENLENREMSDPIQRWRALRQNFTRHHKNGNMNWLFYNEMLFLSEFIKHKPQDGVNNSQGNNNIAESQKTFRPSFENYRGNLGTNNSGSIKRINTPFELMHSVTHQDNYATLNTPEHRERSTLGRNFDFTHSPLSQNINKASISQENRNLESDSILSYAPPFKEIHNTDSTSSSSLKDLSSTLGRNFVPTHNPNSQNASNVTLTSRDLNSASTLGSTWKDLPLTLGRKFIVPRDMINNNSKDINNGALISNDRNTNSIPSYAPQFQEIDNTDSTSTSALEDFSSTLGRKFMVTPNTSSHDINNAASSSKEHSKSLSSLLPQREIVSSCSPPFQDNTASTSYRWREFSGFDQLKNSSVLPRSPSTSLRNSIVNQSLFKNEATTMEINLSEESGDISDVENFIVGEDMDHCYNSHPQNKNQTIKIVERNVEREDPVIAQRPRPMLCSRDNSQGFNAFVLPNNQQAQPCSLSRVSPTPTFRKNKPKKNIVSQQINPSMPRSLKVPKLDKFALKKNDKNKQEKRKVEEEIITACQDFRNLNKKATKLMNLKTKEIKNRITTLPIRHMNLKDGFLDLIRKE
ncbi:probable cyclin-dependent serine/threonine-protein kinase DDB_G0292550 isoform X1 [Leptopilina heterotoma]|uniref:probable cyclin-dependent serine/threonine-protein kinase DDB_G0292550 isoform X1 n=1 Tax=Leptopilina heterotoma TaxID=63436 RepID=UPI001CA96056|nr:probable cyclin-dependent serine/threonine-protein kinase DDB_G0292550 isoform X1 [Leptopilina heterotoma]